ncbi:MBL fold metallo-hydrolase [Thalassotalea sp. M1531]|uniref:MBL fold metallo-hydrolase n=1 Tax=Thalassotalea algicola TaxID=2716224 RepID=A0A7Y0Q7S2_9GAMM|nr:MBL fold metallo-hydrolase [Thalassotalea algicola]NMP32496.1 MBL fold metallo-hydrolase [Thalassotalea algicola]
MQPVIKHFFHSASFTLTYVVSCPETKQCAIIDPALDFDIFSSHIDTSFAQEIIGYVKKQSLEVKWIMETHAHADHVTAASYLKKKLGGQLVCGRDVTSVQSTFKELFNFPDFKDDGSQFDLLVRDGESFDLGKLTFKVMSTPGHTPDSVTYVIGDHAFIGDTLFMPDSGSARCDFPDGSAALLYQSIQKIYQLDDNVKLYMCHDYQPNGREVAYYCTVAQQKAENIQICSNISEQAYIEKREQRDGKLAVPRLIYPSLQLNIRAGQLPGPESDNQYFLKTPIFGVENLN